MSGGIVFARRRGRPPLVEGESTTPLTVRIPTGVYDRLEALATARSTTLPTLVRELCTQKLTGLRDATTIHAERLGGSVRVP
jgi:hypothetical protein